MDEKMNVSGAYWMPICRDYVLILKDGVYYALRAKMDFCTPQKDDLMDVNQVGVEADDVRRTECEDHEYTILGLQKMTVE